MLVLTSWMKYWVKESLIVRDEASVMYLLTKTTRVIQKYKFLMLLQEEDINT